MHNGYKDAVDDVNSGKTPLEGYEGHKVGNNTRKSNYGEMNTDLKMESITEIDGKPASLTALHEKITDIDTPIKQGIDHIYQNATPPPKYVIVESKYGSSDLSVLSDGKTKQMSDTWINGRNRLKNAVGEENAKLISEALENGEVDRVLSKIDTNGNVTTCKLDDLGNIIGKWQ
ncbi:hypothetical protein [Capnocytophaga canimorsus]|uniref:hypothetical protein n=1 Tax=Capnocytophaga canimorsus TaxID=28188 RepID=UPI001E50D8CE|nr:hypothetical protein [Capnocytophaga canimorsus]